MTSPVTPATHIRLQMAAISAEDVEHCSREQYKAFIDRINRATDEEIEAAARSSIERIYERTAPNRWREA